MTESETFASEEVLEEAAALNIHCMAAAEEAKAAEIAETVRHIAVRHEVVQGLLPMG